MSGRTTRKALITKYHSAVLACNKLDEIVFSMNTLAEGKSEPLAMMSPVLVDAHAVVRRLWDTLREQL